MCGKLKRVSLFSSQVKAGLQIVENGRSSKYWNQIRRTGRGADQRGASPSRCCSFLPLLRSNPSAALNCSGLRSRSPCVLPAAQVWIWKSIFSVRLVFALSVQFSLDQNVFFLSYMNIYLVLRFFSVLDICEISSRPVRPGFWVVGLPEQERYFSR